MFNIIKKKPRRNDLQVINDEMDSLRQKKAELERKIDTYLWPLLFDTSEDEPMAVNITLEGPDNGGMPMNVKVTALWINDCAAIMAATDIQGEAEFNAFFSLEEKVQILNQLTGKA